MKQLRHCDRVIQGTFLCGILVGALLFPPKALGAAFYPDRIPNSVEATAGPEGAVLKWSSPTLTQGVLGYRLWYFDPAEREVGYRLIGDVSGQAVERALPEVRRDCRCYIAIAVLYGTDGNTWVGEKVVQKISMVGGNIESVPPGSVTGAQPGPGQRSGRWGAFWRSALVPGWGQWYRGQKLLGAGYFVGTLGSFGSSLYFGQAGDASYAAYGNATSANRATASYNETLENDNLWRIFSAAAMTLYGLNLADALIFTRPMQGGQTARFGTLSLAWMESRNPTPIVTFRLEI